MIVQIPETVTAPGPYAGTQRELHRRVKSVQRPVEDLVKPLPYQRDDWVITEQSVYGFPNPSSGYISASQISWNEDSGFLRSDVLNSTTVASSTREVKFAYNVAYEKLLEKLQGDGAALLALALERKEAGRMVYNRMMQMANIADTTVELHNVDQKIATHTDWRGKPLRKARAKRRNLVSKMAALLASPPQEVDRSLKALRKRQGLLTTPAELILELRWGWMPTVADIYTALKGFDRKDVVQFTGSAGFERTFTKAYASGKVSMTQNCRKMIRVKLGAFVTVSDATLGELSRLGITNPLSALHEIIPYSWLLDYFSSVGQMIASIDDNLVCSSSAAYVTRYLEGSGEYSYHNGTYNRGHVRKEETVQMRREVHSSPLKPFFVVHTPDLQPWRLATAASLVVLKLSKIKKLSSIPFI